MPGYTLDENRAIAKKVPRPEGVDERVYDHELDVIREEIRLDDPPIGCGIFARVMQYADEPVTLAVVRVKKNGRHYTPKRLSVTVALALCEAIEAFHKAGTLPSLPTHHRSEP